MQKIRDTKELIDILKKYKELIEVEDAVSVEYEITELTDRMCKSKNPKALLFTNVKGYNIPILTNAFGSYDRLKLIFGYDHLEDIGWKLYKVLKPDIPNTFLDKLKKLPELKKLNDALPKVVSNNNLREFSKSVFDIPVLKCWPKDGGRFITLPQVITKDPESGIRNVGMYRIQLLEDKKVAIHWQIHKDGNSHFHKAKRLGKKLEVAIAIGADPICTYSASAPLPPEVDEYLFVGMVRESPLELVKGKTIDIEYPKYADFVIEGYVDPNEELVDEGPFGDHTGFYTPVDKYPALHINTILANENPIYLATIVGPPPQEDKYLGYATERIFLPLIKFNLPEIVDYHLPASGVFHNFCFVSIKKRYPGHAFKVAYALLGLGLMSLEKYIVVFDEWVNVHDIEEVLWIWGNNTDPSRDVIVTKGPIDVLDHSTYEAGFGGKMIIDATTKWKEEGYKREWPEIAKTDEYTKKLIDPIWQKISNFYKN